LPLNLARQYPCRIPGKQRDSNGSGRESVAVYIQVSLSLKWPRCGNRKDERRRSHHPAQMGQLARSHDFFRSTMLAWLTRL